MFSLENRIPEIWFSRRGSTAGITWKILMIAGAVVGLYGVALRW